MPKSVTSWSICSTSRRSRSGCSGPASRHPATAGLRRPGTGPGADRSGEYGPVTRVLHSLHAYFLLPGRTDTPIVYDVESVRDGGSFSSRRVVARQGGKVIFYLSSSFHEVESGFEHLEPVPDGVPGPDECPTLGEVIGEGVRAARRRYGSASGGRWRSAMSETPDPAVPWSTRSIRRGPGSGSGPSGDAAGRPAATPGRSRVRQRPHAAVGDHRAPQRLIGLNVQAASLDHAMWFHRPFRADEWLLYDQISPSASSRSDCPRRGCSSTALVSNVARKA